jgi:hypothetical protein
VSEDCVQLAQDVVTHGELAPIGRFRIKPACHEAVLVRLDIIGGCPTYETC